MARGRLRIYLGAAPGVGKTYAMLSEAHRRVERGTDCVVAFVEHHDRPRTEVHAARPGAGPAPRARLPRHHLHRDGRRRGAGPGRPRSPWSTSWPTPTSPGSPQRQALAGRRGAARRGHRRRLHRQHPAPGVARRRRRVDHRRPAARDRARRGGPPRRPDRAGRHVAPGAAPPDGARQHLPARQGRRGPVQLLPPRQPHRTARAGPAVGGRPGRRVPPAVPRRARHPRHLAGPRTHRGRPDRRPRGPHPDPPGRPDGRQGLGQRDPRRLHRPQRRARPRPRPRNWPSSAPWSRTSAAPSTTSSATTSRPRCSTSPAASTPPRSCSASSRRKTWQYIFGPGVGATVARESGPTSTSTSSPTSEAAKGRGLPVARGARLGRSRIVAGWLVGVRRPGAARRCCSPAWRPGPGPRQRHAALPDPDGRRGPARRAAARAGLRRGRLAAAELLLHPARRTTDHRRPAEHRRHRDLRRGGGRGGLRGRPGRPPHPPGGQAAGRGGDPLLPGRQRAARRDHAWTPCWNGSGRPSRMESVALLERDERRRPVDAAPGSVGAAPVRAPRGRRRGRAGRRPTWRSRCPAGCCPPRTAGCWPPSPPRPPSCWTASGWSARREQARELAEGNRIRTALLAAVSPRPAHPAGRHQGGRHLAALRRRGLVRRRTRPNCWPASRTAPTGSTTWWATCWTCPGCRPARSPR